MSVKVDHGGLMPQVIVRFGDTYYAVHPQSFTEEHRSGGRYVNVTISGVVELDKSFHVSRPVDELTVMDLPAASKQLTDAGEA